MQPTTNTPVPDPVSQPSIAATPPTAVPDIAPAEPATVSHSFQPQTITPEEVQGVPAAGRFDMSSVYPTFAEHQAPAVVQPVMQQQTQQPAVVYSGQTAPLQQVQGVTPTQFAATQQINSSPESWPVEKIDIPMKNIYVVGLVGPMASLALISSVYSIAVFSMLQMFSSGRSTLGFAGAGDSIANSIMEVFSNPGFQAFITAGLIYLNVKITATYYEDLKIPTPVMAAVFSALTTFSTIVLAYKFGIGRDTFSFFSGFGGAYLTLLLSLFSGLLWYPTSVKWGLSLVGSTMKQVYPFIAGGIIILGIGAYLVAVFNSSSNLL